MFDSYGTLHDGVKPLPGVREALIKLQEMGKEIVVVANGWVRLTPTDHPRRCAATGTPRPRTPPLATAHTAALTHCRLRRHARCLSRSDEVKRLQSLGVSGMVTEWDQAIVKPGMRMISVMTAGEALSICLQSHRPFVVGRAAAEMVKREEEREPLVGLGETRYVRLLATYKSTNMSRSSGARGRIPLAGGCTCRRC